MMACEWNDSVPDWALGALNNKQSFPYSIAVLWLFATLCFVSEADTEEEMCASNWKQPKWPSIEH